MSIGFVYILLNPAFPNQIKIGRTARDPQKRAKELSRQTGVPDDFIVLYDEIVSDAKKVEGILHSRFDAFRVKRNKEFFQIPPKEAIKALQESAIKFLISPNISSLKADLLPHFKKYFSDYIDPLITSVELMQLPEICFLEITRQSTSDDTLIKSQEEIPLNGIIITETPTLEELRSNEALLKSIDAYDWIMISHLFPEEVAIKISEEWKRPGGKLEKERKREFND